MPSIASEIVAVMVATFAVALGSLLGGSTAAGMADASTGIALIGLAVVLYNALSREFIDLRNRFGAAVLWGVLEMS